MSRFRLYPEEQRWWSFNDYQAVLDAMRETGARSVVEFGPGSSTLALVEAGAERIDTCEDNPAWAEVYEERLVRRFPGQIRLHRYEWPEGAAITVPPLEGGRFDLGLIDGPLGTERRPEVLLWCLARCTWVLMPTEEFKTRAFLRPLIAEAASAAGRPVRFTETGRLSGAFALVGPGPRPGQYGQAVASC